MNPSYSKRKAELLRLELTDLIAFDPVFQEDFNEDTILDKAIDWVFKDKTSAIRVRLAYELRVGKWTVERFESVIKEVVGE